MPCAGEYNLRLGITKELHPDMVATYQGAPLARDDPLPQMPRLPSMSAQPPLHLKHMPCVSLELSAVCSRGTWESMPLKDFAACGTVESHNVFSPCPWYAKL